MASNNDTDPSRPHDALFKAAFENPVHAAALFRSVLPKSLSARIAWDTLTLMPGSFINPRLADRHSDLLFSVLLDGRLVLLYVLLEHQSTVVREMPFRMLEYLVLIWRRHRKLNDDEQHLPLIIPLLISHAPGGWTEPLSFAELLDPNPHSIPGVAPFVPNFTILLEDLAHLSNDELRGRALAAFPKLALWLLRDARDADTLFDNLAVWTDLFREALSTPDGMEAVTLLLRYIARVTGQLNFQQFHDKIVEQLPETEYAAMTVAEELHLKGLQQGLQQGREEGREEGREQGIRQARVDVLQKLVTLKFGEVDAQHVDRIKAASVEQLDRYVERILTAPTIEALLAD